MVDFWCGHVGRNPETRMKDIEMPESSQEQSGMSERNHKLLSYGLLIGAFIVLIAIGIATS